MNLEPGEVICDECNGKKEFYVYKDWRTYCEKCKGTGKLDWIEAIVGKKSIEDDYIFDYAAKKLSDQIDKEILESIIDNETRTR